MPAPPRGPAYAAARLRWRLYGTPVPARLWPRLLQGPVLESSRLSRAQLRQLHWDCLAREADRGYFRPDRLQLLLRARQWRARRRRARRAREAAWRAGQYITEDDRLGFAHG